jgi:hypothetical protein
MMWIEGTIMRQFKNFFVALYLLAAIGGGIPQAFGAVLFSDDFSAANGPLAGTTPDVGGVWTPTAAAATPLQIATGAVQFGTSGQDEYGAFTIPLSTAAGRITTSMDINVSAAQATGDYFSHLSNPAGTTTIFLQRLFARSSENGFQLGLLDTSGTNSATTWGNTVLNFGTPYHVDVNWNFVPGNNNDTFAVRVNNAPYLTHTWTSVNAEPTHLAAANLRQGGAANAATLTVDNLVVDGVPEPATAALAGIISLLSIMRRSRGA